MGTSRGEKTARPRRNVAVQGASRKVPPSWVPLWPGLADKPDTQIKSCARALELLVYFARRASPARGTTIATELGWPRSSTHEMLKCLVDMGFLNFRADTKAYMPSFSLVTLGANLADAYYGGDAIQRILRRLHDKTGELAALYVENGNHMQCLATIPGVDFEPESHGVGAKANMLASSSGRVCLSMKKDSQIVATVRRITEGQNPQMQIETARSVLDSVRQVRHQGFAVRPVPYPSGLSGVSVCLPLKTNGLPLIVGMGYHKVGEEAAVAAMMRSVVQGELAGV